MDHNVLILKLNFVYVCVREHIHIYQGCMLSPLLLALYLNEFIE